MNITGEPEQPPLKEGAPLAQLGAGQNAFVATMTALLHAEDTGPGAAHRPGYRRVRH